MKGYRWDIIVFINSTNYFSKILIQREVPGLKASFKICFYLFGLWFKVYPLYNNISIILLLYRPIIDKKKVI